LGIVNLAKFKGIGRKFLHHLRKLRKELNPQWKGFLKGPQGIPNWKAKDPTQIPETLEVGRTNFSKEGKNSLQICFLVNKFQEGRN